MKRLVRYTYWPLLLPAIIAFIFNLSQYTPSAAAEASSLFDIVAPKNGQRLTSLPVDVRVRFNSSVKRDRIKIKLNNKDITSKFLITSEQATSSLNIKDGIRFAAEPGKFAKNQIVVQILQPSINKIITKTKLFFVGKPRPIGDPSVSLVIASGGGIINLDTYGSISFPSGAFTASQLVRLSATQRTETAADFDATKSILSAGLRLPYELRINSGQVAPNTDFTATIPLSSSFLASLPSDAEVQVFAQILENGGDEVLDSFELFPSTFSAAARTITATLPREAFTDLRTADASFEAIILVATTPTRPSALRKKASRIDSGDAVERTLPLPRGATLLPRSMRPQTSDLAPAATCEGATLGPPLSDLRVTSTFNGRTHFGTDYAAGNGTDVTSMADGVIETIAFDERPLPRPDPRSGKTVKGWGRYVVVRHTDGSKTLYAHLQDTALAVNEPVTRGEIIGHSDNTGGSSGPHLHVEYAPNGEIFVKASKVDPEACIGQNVTGSITVRDNGSLADDAFRVAINGLVVCQTTIGASNTCGVGGLRPGTATLTITAVVAPDDVGTFEITLGSGLTFSGGSTSASGTLPQGGSMSFTIIIPVSPTLKSTQS